MYSLAATVIWIGFTLWGTLGGGNGRRLDRQLYDRTRGDNGPTTDDATYMMLLHIRQDIALLIQVLISMIGAVLLLIAFVADGIGPKLAAMLPFLHLG